jgi:hypothetical protein
MTRKSAPALAAEDPSSALAQDTTPFHGFNSVFDIHGDLLSDMRTAGQIVLP